MEKLRISCVGLSEWESVFVETTVNLAAGIEIAAWDCVADPSDADVLLVANDDGATDLPEVGPDGHRRPITCGVSRPVTHSDLIATLRELEDVLRTPVLTDTVEAVDVEEEASVEEEAPPIVDDVEVSEDAEEETCDVLGDRVRPARRLHPATRYLGLLQQAIQHGRTVEITHPTHPAVTIFPNENAYTSLGEPLMVPDMFRTSSLEFFKREISDVIAVVMLSVDRRQPLWQLVYCAALFGSEGRLLPNYDAGDTLALMGEPEFGSVPYTAEHRQISSHLLETPATLSELVTATGINAGTVIDFCNACEAIGLVRRVGHATGGASAMPAEIDDDSHLMKRVRHLFDPT
ncbi:MAG: hypothetical protein QNJ07_03440 [Woeseiaceae bacterium]|nr:hypothetical protein [Woeseiaceae bacterium]